jgi:enediyne biosynthesis protein E4
MWTSESGKPFRWSMVVWLSLQLVVSGCRSKDAEEKAGVLENQTVSKIVTEVGSEAKAVESDAEPVEIESAFAFKVVASESGLEFLREDDIRGQRRIIESAGGGVAMLDLDGDGLLDLFYTGGCRVPEELSADKTTCGLFRNRGSMKFVNATDASELKMSGYCHGCAVGDVDADGFDDLYVTAFGANAMWRNNGDGTFTEVTEQMGVEETAWSTSCAFADFNLDGNLDLYVVNYLNESATNPLLCPNPRSPDGFEQCPPSKYAGVDDRLFLSDGKGGFIDATTSSGLAGKQGKGLGVLVCDFNLDGVVEIYVANDGEANFLFVAENVDGEALVYQERALASGCALSGSGYAQASMGVAAGDYDGNGTIDILLTHFYGDSNTLYKNLGDLQFVDATRTSGLLGPSRGTLGWGAVFKDFDGDGREDLFVANGHVEDRRWMNQSEPYAMAPQIFRNAGRGRFEEAGEGAGEYFSQTWLGRGVAAGDLDRDGRIDLAVSHQLEPSVVLWNQTELANRGLFVRLVGRESNRSGIAATLFLADEKGGKKRVHQVVGGGSFQAASNGELQISLEEIGDDRLGVFWPSGGVEWISDLVGAGRRIVVEGSGASH